jgi:UDP-N-acetylglucosamine 2-epimerase
MNIAPVMTALRRVPDLRQVLVHTGGTMTLECRTSSLWMPQPDHFLGVGLGTHAEQTARVILRLEPVLAAELANLLLRFLSLMMCADAVLTDSGLAQEETTVLGVPCFTLRANTERPITVERGASTVLRVGQAVLKRLIVSLDWRQPAHPVEPEASDGQAAERVRTVIMSRIAA